VRTALETIEDVARETIGEIDGIIRGLRERSDGDIEPPTGLAAVRTLADRHHAGGLETEIEIEGQERQLAPALDQAGYRILQESLTNAARYGNGKADVRIGYGPERLELTVSNEISPQPAQGGGGHGILGMRERAELLGGTLVAGPHGEVFVVRATLPY
jgi:signal transduction histidine kinase